MAQENLFLNAKSEKKKHTQNLFIRIYIYIYKIIFSLKIFKNMEFFILKSVEL